MGIMCEDPYITTCSETKNTQNTVQVNVRNH